MQRAGENGQELVELALVLPLLAMLLLGIFWIGRAYNIYETITRAAREGARYAAAPYCSSCANSNQLPTASSVQAVVDAALSASALDPTMKTSYNFQQNVPLNGSGPRETGVVVSFGYPVGLAIPFTSLNATTISITTSVQMRQENQ